VTDLERATHDWHAARLAFNTATARLMRLGGVPGHGFRDASHVLRIQEATAAYFGVPMAVFESRTRTEEFVLPRHVAMFLCREFTTFSNPELGRMFRRDPATVSFAARAIRERAAQNPDLAERIRVLRDQLRGQLGIAA
jgi:chromosomal replication initiation ATPase DnaA